jgi:hypothetical protein
MHPSMSTNFMASSHDVLDDLWIILCPPTFDKEGCRDTVARKELQHPVNTAAWCIHAV